MKSPRMIPVLCFAIVLSSLVGLPAQKKRPKAKAATVHAVHKKGKFLYAKAKSIKISIGKQLVAKTDIHKTDFFGKPAISCQLDIVNKSKVKLYIHYHVAFFDKAGNLIGCASQSMDFDPGARTTVGGALVRSPAAALAKVASYQLRYWESRDKL